LEKLEIPDLRERKFACLSYKVASLFSPDIHVKLKKNALSIITTPLRYGRLRWRSNDATYTNEGVAYPIVMPFRTLVQRDVGESRAGLCKETVRTRNTVARITVGKVFASSISPKLIALNRKPILVSNSSPQRFVTGPSSNPASASMKYQVLSGVCIKPDGFMLFF